MIAPRRKVLRGIGALMAATAAPALISSRSAVAMAPAMDGTDGRVRNRLELWENYASKTTTLVSRYVVVRQSALLREPLSNGGTLAFHRPDRLVFRDDGAQGSMTLVTGGSARVVYLSAAGPAAPRSPGRATDAAASWLCARLLALLGGPDRSALLHESRVHVPKGAGYRLELLPQRDSQVRKSLRAVTVQLDPVQGAIAAIAVAEAQGDQIRFELADVRQNVPTEELEVFFRLP